MAATGYTPHTATPMTLAAMTLPRRVRRALENQLQTAVADLNRQLQVVLQETGLELGKQAERSHDHHVQSALYESIRKLRDAEAGGRQHQHDEPAIGIERRQPVQQPFDRTCLLSRLS